MNQLLLIPIVAFAKLLTLALQVSGRGSGTALPGYLVGRYFPFVLEALVSQIPVVVAITGTNGKTTSQTMLSAVLDQVPQAKVLRNKAGANLSQGILSELLKQSNAVGRLDCTHAVLEVEEATLPRIARLIKPNIIAVTNLYRDQLDAYGEIDRTEKLIRDGIAQCPTAAVVVNGDDPRTARLTQGLGNATYFMSLAPEYARFLPYEGQLNHRVPGSQGLEATNIHINEDLTTDFSIQGQINHETVHLPQAKTVSPGFFHVYNALTAIAIANLLGIDGATAIAGLKTFKPAFGRGEILTRQRGDKQVNYRLLLVKNPASFSLSLELLRNIPALKLILAINDNTADGKDVSWLWDSELERLNQTDIDWILCTGIRAKDMAVRLKYALDAPPGPIPTDESIRQAIDLSFDKANTGDTVFVLPTYTAMLEFRKLMGKTLDVV
ncbi:MurT ligase domain-containing protein [Leptolyngbya sp. CCNP1308]|uniref:MurT ligase domain-containing protein n=1 Tax=Leptolyngbya sp. CCNP1308 TaxID=3110255 RepID=UPI002B1EEC9E|nr:MurT ligase domain-containing protein [Leptolyngbya sp. CCNP1308]MEA5451377.1 MurT ligase domain-containing protein [Leptolyngbya sp. CCNP1308]